MVEMPCSTTTIEEYTLRPLNHGLAKNQEGYGGRSVGGCTGRFSSRKISKFPRWFHFYILGQPEVLRYQTWIASDLDPGIDFCQILRGCSSLGNVVACVDKISPGRRLMWSSVNWLTRHFIWTDKDLASFRGCKKVCVNGHNRVNKITLRSLRDQKQRPRRSNRHPA